MPELIISLISVILVVCGQGLIFKNFTSSEGIDHENFYDVFIYGIILLSFTSLLLNFFTPINKLVGTIIFVVSLVYFIQYFVRCKSKKKVIFNILVISIITFLLVAYSFVNRPDAGLYHLPYISLINENKIIFGVSNLHFRFGHISILQYLSAAFNNYLIPIEAISIPSAIFFSSFIIYLFKNFYKKISENNYKTALVFFLFIVFSIYSFNRYSEYGNDTPSHILFAFFTLLLINQKELNRFFFARVCLISVYLFSIKPFMFILSPIILYFFLRMKDKFKILVDRKIIFSLLFLILWISKNLITSGCVIYPISKTCLSNLSYVDIDKTKIEEYSGEAWSKDWIHYKEKKYNIQEFNKKLRWFPTWKGNHFKIIFEKFGPFILFLFIMFFILLLNKDKRGKAKEPLLRNKAINNYIILTFLIFSCLIWFLKFPLYRYGSSFLATSAIFIFYLFIKDFNFKLKSNFVSKLMKFSLIIAVIAFTFKNLNRIVKNYDKRTPLPQIYSLQDNLMNKQQQFEKVHLNDDGFYFYSHGSLCMYSKSPCTHVKLNDINFKKKFVYYKMFYKK